MSDCDQRELEIEMWLHGALEPERASQLSAHLASCAKCRGFEATARQMESTMQMTVHSLSDEIDWSALKNKLQVVTKPHRYVLLFPVGLALGLLVSRSLGWLWDWTRGKAFNPSVPRAWWISCAVVGAILSALMLYRSRKRLAEARSAETVREALVTFCRNELDRQIEDCRRMIWLAAGLGLVFTASTVSIAIVHHLAFARVIVFLLVVVGVFGGLVVYWMWVQLPRLRRELAELS